MSVLYKGKEIYLKNLGFSRFCAFSPLTASLFGIILLLCVAVSYWRSSHTMLFLGKEKPLTAASCGEGSFQGKRRDADAHQPTRPPPDGGSWLRVKRLNASQVVSFEVLTS